MQVSHIRTLQPAQNGISRVQGIAWSPNNKRLAVVDAGRTVHLYDEAGERRDKFTLRSAEGKEQKTFVVKSMAFSPDSTKLAVCQSDYMICVFKLGADWGERKAIISRFAETLPITAMCWPSSAATGVESIVFGMQDGKVRAAGLKTKKTTILYSHDSPVMCMCPSPDGSQVVVGHADGTVMRYTFPLEDGSPHPSNAPTGVARLCTHTSAPYSIAFADQIAVAGSGADCRIVFYDRFGHEQQKFELDVLEEREISCIAFSPSGQALVASMWNKLRMFDFNVRSRRWDEGVVVPLNNALSIPCAVWKSDGSRIVTGTLTGAVDTFDACLRRYTLRGAFEFTYVSHNQVIVKRLATGARVALKSHMGYEIMRVNVHKDRYLVAHTQTTLLVGDLGSCKLSEVPWQLSGKEVFYFDNPQVCMVHMAGELTLIEYGRNEVLGTCRTQDVNTHRISVRVHEAPVMEGQEAPAGTGRKAIAYLIDRQTIQVDDLQTGISAARISHSVKVDWLELNHRANRLLFRDKQHQLFVFDMNTQTKSTLLNYCTYAQWVPDSDVVVAQNRSDLCVWYSINAPDRVAVSRINGDVEGIERGPNGTSVLVDEGTAEAIAYHLDEALIEFGSAMEDHDYDRAADLLDRIALTTETEALWEQLAAVALQESRLYIAERCYAALGNVAKAAGLKKVNELARRCAQEMGATNPSAGYDHFLVHAELYLLNRDPQRAEQVYLDNGQVEKAMDMWDELLQYDKAIAIAEARAHPDAANRRAKYFNWLMESGQEELAAEVREREGKHIDAINLYLRGGVPARAAHVVTTYNVKPDQHVLEAIASALFKAEVYEKAGDFFEKLKLDERAIDAYKRGHVYRRAVELARRAFPSYVVGLEDAWGDWLVSQKQVDQAINHFIEASQFGKAIQSAIASRQWTKAVSILETQTGGAVDAQAPGFYRQIAIHYEEANQLAEAEKFYVKGGAVQDAVEMYMRRGMSDHMMRVAQRHLTHEQLVALFIEQAKVLEAKGDFAGAERVYIRINQPDPAIIMYKKARDFVNMIRLVQTFRPEFLLKTHLSLANQFAKDGHYKLAEQHFISGKDWNSAVVMYRDLNMWDDAVRVARIHGGPQAAQQVVLSRAFVVDADEAVRLLAKFSLLDQGIEAAMEALKFESALAWAQRAMPAKQATIWLKWAMNHEDQGEFRQAEDAFVKAGKPREAIDMYIHQQDFEAAMRVAEHYDAAGIPIVCTAQGRIAFGAGNYKEAEALLLRGNAAELLVKLYRDAKMLADARRVAREHAPEKAAEIAREEALTSADPMAAAQSLEDNKEFQLAIEQYLRVGREHTQDQNRLVAAWRSAVRLASQHSRLNLRDTVKVAVQHMVDEGRFPDAAITLEETDDFKGAISLYCRADMFDKAEALAQRISPDLVDFVKRERIKSAFAKNEEQSATDGAKKDRQLDAFVQNNEWEKAMKVARQKGPDQARAYASLYCQALLKEGNIERALEVIARDGMESDDIRFFKVFTQLAFAAATKLPNPKLEVQPLHDGLYRIVQTMTQTGQDAAEVAHAQAALNILHCYSAHELQVKHGLTEQAYQSMLALPRYVPHIAADKAYFDAGIAAREAGQPAMAFVFLNHFLDITDMIQDGERTSDNLEPRDFALSDYPQKFPLPKSCTVPEEAADEARQWVLTKSLDPSFKSGLPTVVDPATGATMFVATLRAPGSAEPYDACAVTGMPILNVAQRVRCTACTRPAELDAWNRYLSVAKCCPWCKAPQNIVLK